MRYYVKSKQFSVSFMLIATVFIHFTLNRYLYKYINILNKLTKNGGIVINNTQQMADLDFVLVFQSLLDIDSEKEACSLVTIFIK